MEEAVAHKDIDTMWENDRRFHWLILAATGNDRLVDYVDSLRDLVLTKAIFTAGKSREPEAIVAEHAAILNPMERRNVGGAAKAMSDHLENTAKLLIKQQAEEAGISFAENKIDFSWTACPSG